MSTLEFSPTGIFQMRHNRIARDGVAIGEIRCSGMRGGAAITIGGATYTAAREGLIRETFYLEANGQRLATALVASAVKGGFTIKAGGRTFTLGRASAFGRAFALTENGTRTGTIARRGVFSSTSIVDLPDDLSPGLKAFVMWLMIVLWQRMVLMVVIIAVIGVASATASGR